MERDAPHQRMEARGERRRDRSHAAPDQVELTTWNDVELQPWVAYKMQHAEEKNTGRRVKVAIGGDREIASAVKVAYPSGEAGVEAIPLDIDESGSSGESVMDSFGPYSSMI